MMEEQMLLLDISPVRIKMRALQIRYNFTSIFYEKRLKSNLSHSH
jgi:hypothetical protein